MSTYCVIGEVGVGVLLHVCSCDVSILLWQHGLGTGLAGLTWPVRFGWDNVGKTDREIRTTLLGVDLVGLAL